MNSNTKSVFLLIIFSILILLLEYLILSLLNIILPDPNQSLFKIIFTIGGMMFFVNFLAYILSLVVHSIQPSKSLFIYFFTILLKMIFVIILVLFLPVFKNNILLVMLNYILFLFLTILFLKNKIME